MTILEFFKGLTMGGWVALFVTVSTLVEIAPVKINPIQWLGNRLNMGIHQKVDEIDKKLSNHIAQDSRSIIMNFQNGLLFNGCAFYTKEDYDQVIDACMEYEKFCKDNDISNDKCKLAIDYIERCYKECQNKGLFANLPIQVK